MARQRQILVTVTYNDLGCIIDTKAEPYEEPNLQQTCNNFATDTISRQSAIDNLKRHLNGTDVPDSYPGIFNAIEEWLSDWEVPSAEPEQRWIPCSERMPEESGWYIVTVEDETDTHLRWFSTLHGFEWEEKDNTIAWMPLPEPYKEES